MGNLSKFRILIAGQTPPPLGGQNINIERVLNLLKKRTDLTVNHWEFRFTPDWKQKRQATFGKLVELVKVFGRLIRLRLAGPIDLILIPSGGPHTVPIIRDWLLLPPAALASRNVLVHFRAAGLAESLPTRNPIFQKITRLIYRKCTTRAVVLSNFGARDSQSVGIPDHSVLSNGVEDWTENFERKSSSGNRILHVGHLCPDKGTPELIAAFGHVYQNFPDAKLILVGGCLPPYTPKQLATDIAATGFGEDQIKWLGEKTGDDLAKVYRDSDLFVFSSVAPYESFGMVMIEAMMWSLPIVATNWRANAEVLTSEFGGILAENPEQSLEGALHTALSKALEEKMKWSEWGNQNRSIYEERYQISVFEKNLNQIIDEYRRSNRPAADGDEIVQIDQTGSEHRSDRV